jgi:hypothetical protein
MPWIKTPQGTVIHILSRGKNKLTQEQVNTLSRAMQRAERILQERPMTLQELERIYKRTYRVLHRERRMREHVLANKPDLSQRLAEMDEAIETLTRLKDELKTRLESELNQPIQRSLIDTPAVYITDRKAKP